VKVLEDGFTKFPQSQSILIGLINYYLTNNENPDRLFELISLAKQNEPNNASLPYVEGNIFVELRKADPANAKDYEAKAIAAYDACAVINPEYEYGYIGKGIMFYNIALELQEKASDPSLSWEAWEDLNKEFAQYLKSALEPFETAYNVTKDNSLKVNIADFLKNIYYRFYSEGPEWEAGYNKYNEVVKTGQAQ
jgi:tetratricopeptide (TPR) repeat protein